MAQITRVDLKRKANELLTSALGKQRPAAIAYVRRIREVHPSKSPTELTKILDAWYLTGVTTTGAGAGAAAIVPNGWLQTGAALIDLGTFLEASVFYVLARAEIYGVHPEDNERRRLLVLGALIGDSAVKGILGPILDRSVPHWGKLIVNSIPMKTINAANKVLGPRFITKYGAKQGILVLGKQIPLGIGVAVGAGGNHVFGRTIIAATKKMLGPAPENWSHLDYDEHEVDPDESEIVIWPDDADVDATEDSTATSGTESRP